MKHTMKMYLILSGLVLCLATGWTQDAPTREERHAGDLGNIVADENGVATKSMTVNNIELTGEHSILGRAVIVHAKADTGEQPTGGAGARIAYGVIGLKNPETKTP